MDESAFRVLDTAARQPDALAKSVEYVAGNLSRFLKKREYVLICFPKRDYDALGTIFEQAVLQLDAVPVFWGPDYRWKTLLRQAFANRATTIIGPPRVILGLSKLAKATGTPLNIRNVVTAGYPCMDWMIDGIIKGLDCSTWGCFGPGTGAVVSGFSCGCSRGVHIRQDSVTLTIEDSDGNPVPDGEEGEIVLQSHNDPTLRCRTGEHGRLDRSVCRCGQDSPRLMNIGPGGEVDDVLTMLDTQFQSWTSILDCRLEKGQYGLEMELVVFPGEKLPKLPTCAKRIIRPWKPEEDIPLGLFPVWKYPQQLTESH